MPLSIIINGTEKGTLSSSVYGAKTKWIFEDQIINQLTGKEKCLYNGLNKQGNSYVKDLMNNFEGTSEFDINIVSKDKVYRNGKEVNAKTTKGKSSNFITIEIRTSRATSRAALGCQNHSPRVYSCRYL